MTPARFNGLYFTFWADDGTENGCRYAVWPWRFGWHYAQSHLAFFFGPAYLLWSYK